MKPKLTNLTSTTGTLLLATLLTTTSALSLQNFQSVDITAVPVKCLLVYDSTIPSCTKADFATGNTCSSSCVSALTTLQSEINTACAGTEVSSSTLLGMVFNGNLVSAICQLSETTSASAASSKTSAATIESVQTTATSDVSTSTTTEATTTAASSTEQTTTVHSTTTSTHTTTVHASTSLSTTLRTFTSTISSTTASTTSTSSSSAAITDQTSATSSDVASSTSTSSTSKAKASKTDTGLSAQQSEQLQAMSHTGGGSLFDIVASKGSRLDIKEMFHGVLVIGWGVWLVL